MSGSVSRRPLGARYGYQYLKGVWVEGKGELLRGKKRGYHEFIAKGTAPHSKKTDNLQVGTGSGQLLNLLPPQ